jgi:beta-RFAP synthase
MPASVTVTTGARLHFGLLVGDEDSTRFAGAGLMIDEPGFVLRVETADQNHFDLPNSLRDRTSRILETLQTAWGRALPPVVFRAERTIPAHQGLGSGTQFALAVATALAKLAAEPTDAAQLAALVERGRRSRIGIHGFQSGGFLIDSGEPPLTRLAFPDDWRIVLVAPRAAAGLSGPEELAAFSQLAPMRRSEFQRLLTLLETDLVHAIHAADFDSVRTLLDEYGTSVGRYFAEIQGGVFASPFVAKLAQQLREESPFRLVQSSWGPTAAALCRDAHEAGEFVERVRSVADSLDLRIAAPLNAAARVEDGSKATG